MMMGDTPVKNFKYLVAGIYSVFVQKVIAGAAKAGSQI